MATKRISSENDIKYPFIHEQGQILYVDESNPYMQAAKEFAEAHSLDSSMPTGSVVVKDGKIIGQGANGSKYHEEQGCRRVELGIPTGQGYELCEGCHPKNHSEPKAIADALKHEDSLVGAELYLWGHWWCCEPCWNSMVENDIYTAKLLEGSEVIFNKPRVKSTGGIK